MVHCHSHIHKVVGNHATVLLRMKSCGFSCIYLLIDVYGSSGLGIVGNAVKAVHALVSM